MSETYKIKFDRRGLPGSQQSRITEPYTLENLHQMFSAYMTEGLIVDLSPREVKLVETAAGALERLKKVEASQEDGVGEQGNPLLDRANATIERLTEERDGVCARQDEEIGHWQQAIYELCCKAVEGLRETITIDGAGCDSGDPLDFTLTEITQAVNGLRDEIDSLTQEYDKAKLERNKARMDLVGVRQDVKRMEDAWRRAETEIGWVRKERDKVRAELLRARNEIDLLTQERNIARAEIESLKARPRTPYLDGDRT